MSEIWHRLSLPAKIALPVTLLCLLCSLAVVGVLQQSQQSVVAQRVDALGEALVSRLADSAAPALVAGDALTLQAVATGYASEAAVQRAAIYDKAHHLAAAAGDTLDAGGIEFTHTIRWQNGAVGEAVLSLHADTSGSEMLHASDLAAVAVAASLFAGLLALWAGRRIDRLLGLLARRLAGEQIEIGWRGRDQLGRLLRTPAPPVLATDSIVAEQSDWALLQLYCPAETGTAADLSLRHAENVAQLYGGEASANRAGGVLIRFRLGATAEEQFQIVCAAILLNELTRPDGARLALTTLSRIAAEDRWQEQAAIEAAYGVTLAIADGRLALDAAFASDACVSARVKLSAQEHGWMLANGLTTPYDALLRRQCAALKLAA